MSRTHETKHTDQTVAANQQLVKRTMESIGTFSVGMAVEVIERIVQTGDRRKRKLLYLSGNATVKGIYPHMILLCDDKTKAMQSVSLAQLVTGEIQLRKKEGGQNGG